VERTHAWMNGYGKLRRFTDKHKIVRRVRRREKPM
jgi:hypothetical protein